MIKANVKVIKHDLSQFDGIDLIPLSDLHWDEPQSDHDAIRYYVDKCKKKGTYCILNGDLVTAPTGKSAASVYEMGEPGGEIEFPSLDKCADELEELFTPIKNKILACCSGGHELKHLFRVTGMDWTYNLMKRLGREQYYTRDGGMLLIKTKPIDKNDKSFFKIVFTHGWGGARTRGAKIRKLEYLAQGLDADCYILSHDHTQNIGRDNYLKMDDWEQPYLKAGRKLLISAGAFRAYAGYPFRAGYQPSDLGTPTIHLRKDKLGKDVHASM